MVHAYRWQPVRKKFRRSELGIHFAADPWIAMAVASRHSDKGYMHEVELDLVNPIRTYDAVDHNATKELEYIADYYDETRSRRNELKKYFRGLTPRILRDFERRLWEGINSGMSLDEADNLFILFMKEHGADGIVYENELETSEMPWDIDKTSYIVFDVYQIRMSRDPVVRNY